MKLPSNHAASFSDLWNLIQHDWSQLIGGVRRSWISERIGQVDEITPFSLRDLGGAWSPKNG
jgi:hypothetical protein